MCVLWCMFLMTNTVQGLGSNENGSDDHHACVSKKPRLESGQSRDQLKEVDITSYEESSPEESSSLGLTLTKTQSFLNLGEESSPLGLKLTKTPSFLNLVEMTLSETRSKSYSNDKAQPLVNETKTDDFVPQPMSDREKLKASNFPALRLKIGSWEWSTVQEGDLIAKYYYAKRKIVWEVLEGALKMKIEIQWSDIEAIRAIIRENEPGVLEILLKQAPLFFQETNPQPRKHTIWQEVSDFTGGQARFCRRHVVKFPPGALDKHYEKLLQCDNHLWELSQRPFPNLKYSPYFCSSDAYGVSDIPFDFASCNSPFPLRTTTPFFVPPYQTQNLTRQHFPFVKSDLPMAVINHQWREENTNIDSTFENQWMDPNTVFPSNRQNHLQSWSQNEWFDERNLIAKLRSMCQPFQEPNPENKIGINQLDYDQKTFYIGQSFLGGNEAKVEEHAGIPKRVLGGNEAFEVHGHGVLKQEVDGRQINPHPMSWLPSNVLNENNQMMKFGLDNSSYQYGTSQQKVSNVLNENNQMMKFVLDNSSYQYDTSQQKVMDCASSRVRWPKG